VVPTRPRRVLEDSVHLGRQPIYGVNREIRAYELLYRRAVHDTSANVSDADQASAEVILKAFLEIGLPAIAPERPVFINHTKALLEMRPILPADRCVVEVLETVAADSDTLAAIERLKSAGYRIALDDFIYSADSAPLLRLADYVKLDYRALGESGFAEHAKLLRPYGVRLLAEKIESEREFKTGRNAGCELFQGYYLRKPEVLSGRRIPSNRISVLSLLAECSNVDNSANVIAGIIARDAPLTYALLRLANSAMYRRRSEIRTPAQAVTMLGIDYVFRWATLLALASNDDCPAGYLEAALQRARMCELIAPLNNCTPTEAYVAGLLSTLDSLLNAPMADLVAPLPLDVRYKRALLQREGALGAVLDAATAWEEGCWSAEEQAVLMQKSFWDAAEYSRSMMARMASAAK
jgi:EAL and modified HD-GYP domain-containing signal transduction protein